MSFVSYAQNYEDVMVARALRGIRHGFYIDVGAQDPVDDSVTKAFYEMGWRGINIEPVTHWFQRLVVDRPHDINLQLAVSDRPGRLHLFEVIDSGLSTTDPEFARRHVQAGHQIRESDVECVTLDNICKTCRVTEVHFLKIDCEGGEAATLRGFSLEELRPWIILLEATEPNSQKPAYMEWEPLLTGRGYHFVYEDGLNRFYVADEHVELDEAFSYPPNVFDYFVRASEMKARNELDVAQRDLSTIFNAQHVIKLESECESLRTDADYLRDENERREVALVEHRRLLQEAAEREAQALAHAKSESEQWRLNAEYLRDENERREVALAEHRRLLQEAADREAQAAAHAKSESEQWRLNAEYLRDENERREVALVEHRRLLQEAAEREAQAVAHAKSEGEQWRLNAEYLRDENERREAALVEHRRQLEVLTEHEARASAHLQAEIEQWRNHAECLQTEHARKERALADREQVIAALEQTLAVARLDLASASRQMALLSIELTNHEQDLTSLRTELENRVAEIPVLQNEIGRLHREVAFRDQEVSRLRGLIQMIQRSVSWRITRPLRWMRRGVHVAISTIFRGIYHLLRWPAHLCRPLLRLMARWSWLRTSATRIAGPDSRLTTYTRLFLFGASPAERLGEPSETSQPQMLMTRLATQVLEEIQAARRRRQRSDNPLRSRRK
ncbi:FkbM family methyltransferase [Rhodanobacter sp. AS-Z3]|uniref:FkbM family methyltransferase n=1 Tax=Rhodanobacter sp. AS-Z3 TaxID=3031330 RepID=UPI00247B25B7|nr:FkbM family methyltransferase [Rhodanobacter sp. AS-Z3]WEN14950.1 FkbM family methyltransferase [Rhodanobacter sp. AS-Z3]